MDNKKHKIAVMLELLLMTVGGSALGAVIDALAGYFAEPPTFDISNGAHWIGLWKAAVAGAIAGLIGLFRNLPRNPATWQRRDDPPQVVKAAEKIGIVEPERLARARRQSDRARKVAEGKALEDDRMDF